MVVAAPATRLFVYLAQLAVSDRARLAGALRSGGASILDRAFEERSTIPRLEDFEIDRITTSDVIVPPASRFEAGNQNVAGLVFLVSLARAIDASRVFEIGTYNGLTAHCLARNLPNATIHTLDLPVANQASLPLAEGDSEHVRTYDRRLYEELGDRGRIEQLLGDSASFDYSPYVGRCQLVYIDGAHSHEYVLADSRTAQRLLADRGAIVWDDYSRGMTGVAAALESLAGDLPLRRVPGTRLVVYLTPAVENILL